MRIPCHVLASQRRSGPAAQAKSRTLDAVKRQVLVPGVGRAPFADASALVMIWTRSAEPLPSYPPRARARRARCSVVHTSVPFCTLPVAATTKPAGRVRLTSKSPYSR